MSTFWNHYAQANDDIRNKLIDEAWFERQTGATPFQDDVAMMEEREKEPDPPPPPPEPPLPEPEPDPEHEAVYGRAPEQAEAKDLYGQDMPENCEPAAQPSSDRAFYGYDALDEPDIEPPDMEPEH